jgi:hypothetical protein
MNKWSFCPGCKKSLLAGVVKVQIFRSYLHHDNKNIHHRRNLAIQFRRPYIFLLQNKALVL